MPNVIIKTSFFDLPKDVFFYVYSSMLKTNDILRFWLACNCTITEFITPVKISKYQSMIDELKSLPLKEVKIYDQREPDYNSQNRIYLNKISGYPGEIKNKIVIDIFNIVTCVERISLVNCTKLAEEKIINIIERFPNLKSFNLRGCKQLSNFSIIRLSQLLVNLVYLNLSYCELINNISILELINNCKKLKILKLYGCEKTEDYPILELLEKRFNVSLWLKNSLWPIIENGKRQKELKSRRKFADSPANFRDF